MEVDTRETEEASHLESMMPTDKELDLNDVKHFVLHRFI